MSSNRGEGCVFPRGRIWWVQYSHRGRVFRESSGSQDERIARRLLRKRLGEIGIGAFKGPQVEKTTFEEMAEAIVNDYRINGRKSTDKLGRSLAHLREVFGFSRMIDITTDRINAYILRRQEEKATNATINRELSALKRMFSLGLQSNKVGARPHIPMLKENNVRTGFFEYEDFHRLRNVLPDYLKPLVSFAYYTGWRSEEVRKLRWKQVDLKAGCVRLDVGTTKNDQGRVVFLTQEIVDLLSSLWKDRRLDCPKVFNRNGLPIKDFRSAWENACKRANLHGMLFHDFRRTAVRNMVRAGVPERVAMQISGHKTRSVFDRYHIVSESDLKEAALKVERFSQAQAQEDRKVISIRSD